MNKVPNYFKDKYTTTDNAEKDKIALTTDTYALGEMIQLLIDKIEHARVSLIK